MYHITWKALLHRNRTLESRVYLTELKKLLARWRHRQALGNLTLRMADEGGDVDPGNLSLQVCLGEIGKYNEGYGYYSFITHRYTAHALVPK